MAGLVEIVAGTGGIIGQNIDKTIAVTLYAHSPELGDTFLHLLRPITPFLTGALVSDLTYDAALTPAGLTGSSGKDEILSVFALGFDQLAEWGREYVQYVEGPPLGLPTYTNQPRHIFIDTAEGEGLLATEVWALLYVQEALDLCAIGGGIPL